MKKPRSELLWRSLGSRPPFGQLPSSCCCKVLTTTDSTCDTQIHFDSRGGIFGFREEGLQHGANNTLGKTTARNSRKFCRNPSKYTDNTRSLLVMDKIDLPEHALDLEINV